jgi:hypothetical protein
MYGATCLRTRQEGTTSYCYVCVLRLQHSQSIAGTSVCAVLHGGVYQTLSLERNCMDAHIRSGSAADFSSGSSS